MKITRKNRRKGHENLLKEAAENLIRLEGNINYTTFVLQTGSPQTMSYTLATYGGLLPPTFIRVNKSCIINKKFIENLNPDNRKVTLKDGTEFQISRRRWMEVRKTVVAFNYFLNQSI